MNNENLKKLHANLAKKNPKFTRTFEEFAGDMGDVNNRERLYSTIKKTFNGFSKNKEEFYADMGFDAVEPVGIGVLRNEDEKKKTDFSIVPLSTKLNPTKVDNKSAVETLYKDNVAGMTKIGDATISTLGVDYDMSKRFGGGYKDTSIESTPSIPTDTKTLYGSKKQLKPMTSVGVDDNAILMPADLKRLKDNPEYIETVGQDRQRYKMPVENKKLREQILMEYGTNRAYEYANYIKSVSLTTNQLNKAEEDYSKRKKAFDAIASKKLYSPLYSATESERNELEKKAKTLSLEGDRIKQAKDALSAYQDGKDIDAGLLSSIGKMLGGTAADVLSYGLIPIAKGAMYNSIAEKKTKGEKLTEDESKLLNTAAISQYIQDAYSERTFGQEVGETVMSSIPFMASFVQFGGLTNGVSKLIGKGATKLGMKVLTKEGIKDAGKAGLRGLEGGISKNVAKSLGVVNDVVDNVVKMGGTLTVLDPRTYGKAVENMNGKAGYDIDDNTGQIVYTGQEGSMNFKDALMSAYTTQAIENLSEASGIGMEAIAKPISKTITSFMGKKLPELTRMLKDSNFLQWTGAMAEKAQWNGTIVEFMENNVSTMMHAALGTGQGEWEDLIDPKSNALNLATTMLIGSGGYLANQPGRMVEKQQIKTNYKVAEREFDNYFGEDAETFKDVFKNGTVDERNSTLKSLLSDKNIDNESKKVILDYFTSATRYGAFEEARNQIVEDVVVPAVDEVNSQINEETGTIVHAIVNGVDTKINGNVVFMEDGTIDKDNSTGLSYDEIGEDGQPIVVNGVVSQIPIAAKDLTSPTQIDPIQARETAVNAATQPLIDQFANEDAPEYKVNDEVRTTSGLFGKITQVTPQGYVFKAQTGEELVVQGKDLEDDTNVKGIVEDDVVEYMVDGVKTTGTVEDINAGRAIGEMQIDGNIVKYSDIVGKKEEETEVNEVEPVVEADKKIVEADMTENAPVAEVEEAPVEEVIETTPEVVTPKTFAEQIPTKKVGKKTITDYEAVAPEITAGALKEDFEDYKEVNEIIDVKIKDFEKQIKSVGVIKKIADIDQYKANVKAAKEKVDALTNQLEYWKAVKEAAKPIDKVEVVEIPLKETKAQRLERWGEPKNLNELIMYKIIDGQKIRWDDILNDKGVSISKGLGAEYRNSNSERLKRFGLLSPLGLTPDQLSHKIWEANAYEEGQFDDIPLYGLDTQEILNEILDVLNTYVSTGQMISDINIDRAQLSKDEQAYLDKMINESDQEIDSLSDDIYAEVLGLTDLTAEQLNELNTLQNETDRTTEGTSPTIAETTKSVEQDNAGEEVKPIRQLGTDSNVYFEENGLRVNDDTKNGGVLLLITQKGSLTPDAELKYDNAEEAVSMAKKINKAYPNGIPEAVDVKGMVKYFETPEISTEQVQLETELNPTEAQKKAGNYKKAHISISGMDISIENPIGSVRSGKDEDGKAWEHEMKSHYGYFLNTVGKDGDHIDVFVKENVTTDFNGTVFAIDQINPNTGEFDETKVMLGYDSVEEAQEAYMENYDKDWKGLSAITPISVDSFKTWLYDGAKQRKAFSEYKETPEAVIPATEELDIKKIISDIENGIINSDDAAIKIDESGVEVDTDLYDKLRLAEKYFIDSKLPLQVGDIVTVKGKNGNMDFDGNFRGFDNNGKLVVYSKDGFQGVYDKGDVSKSKIKSIPATEEKQTKDQIISDIATKKIDAAEGVKKLDELGNVDKAQQDIDETFDWAKLFEENKATPEEIESNKQAALEAEYQQMGFDKKWAPTREIAIQKLNENIAKNEAIIKDWSARVYKKSGGKTVEVGNKNDDYDTRDVNVDAINERKRANVIKNAQSEIADDKKDLKRLDAGQVQLHTGSTFAKVTMAEEKALIDVLNQNKIADVKFVTTEEIPSILDGTEQKHVVYHGSPHSFDQFSLDHIGTGEGAQAYGYGLYFTGKKAIAEDYAKKLGESKVTFSINGQNMLSLDQSWPYGSAKQTINSLTPYFKEVNKRFKREAAELKDWLKKGKFRADIIELRENELKAIEENIEIINTILSLDKKVQVIPITPRNLYSVELHEGKNPSEYDYMRWDKFPTKEQSDKVLAQAKKEGLNITKNNFNVYDGAYGIPTALKGDMVYKSIAGELGSDKDASLFLLRAGIDGIQYPANFTTGKANETDFNYVVFDPSAITIKEKVQFMKTPQGTIYGFVKDGKVYINKDTLNLNTPIHEFGHIFIDGIEGTALFNKGAELIKQTPYFTNLENDPNYSHLSEKDRVKEAMAAAIGDNGAQIVKDKGLLERLKEWIADVWKRIGSKAGIENLTSEQISNLTLQDFVDIATSEVLSGKKEASIDDRYFAAIERGDMETAQKIVDKQAADNGYMSNDDYRDGHSAPVSQYEKADFTNLDVLREGTLEDSNDINVFGLAHGISNQPDDYFSPQGARWYGYDDAEGYQSSSAIKSAIRSIKSQINEFGEVKDMPKITVYRAVPKSLKEKSIRNGDWVTPSLLYAKSHGKHRLGNGEYRIMKEDISATDLWWDGNDINEFGVDNGESYSYKNTKNNRKLNDVIVRDKKGNIIPPSKRFNSTTNTQFQIIGEQGASNLDKAEEATIRLDNLKIAKEMEATKTPQEIRMATGWEKGADGKWKYEVMDVEINDKHYSDLLERKYTEDIESGLINATTLGELYDSKELYSAYPELENMQVILYEDDNQSASASYNPNEKAIYIYNPLSLKSIEGRNSNLIHEIQHAIQSIEGFAKGGNQESKALSTAKQLDSLKGVLDQYNEAVEVVENQYDYEEDEVSDAKQIISDIDKEYDSKFTKRILGESGLNGYIDFLKEKIQEEKENGFDYYKQLAGETESRNAQSRMNMTEEERRNTPLSETEDVARDEQIVMFDEPVQANSQGEAPTGENAAELNARIKRKSTLFGLKLGSQTSFVESVIDAWTTVKQMEDFMRSKGMVISDNESFYKQATHTSGRIAAWLEVYENAYLKPLQKTIHDMVNKGVTYQDVERFAMITHGLEERNPFFNAKEIKEQREDAIKNATERIYRDRKRDAEEVKKLIQEVTDKINSNKRFKAETKNKRIADAIKKIKTEVKKTDAQKEEMLKKAIDKINKRFDLALEQSKMSKDDVLAYWNNWHSEKLAKIDSDFEEHGVTNAQYYKKVEQLDKRRDFEIARSTMSDYSGITAFEEELGDLPTWLNNFKDKVGDDLINKFWGKVKENNDFVLDVAVRTGMMNRDFANDLKARWNKYVPLRGFDGVTAEDVHDYTPNMGVFFTAPMQKIKGRKSIAETPFAYMSQMAQSAIVAGEKNIGKQAFARLAKKDTTGLIRPAKSWYQYVGEVNGVKEFELAEPTYSEDAEQFNKNIDAFEERMQTLRSQGLAYEKNENPDFGFAHIKKAQKEQHAVRVSFNGKESTYYVMSDPRISRAINGNMSELSPLMKVFRTMTSGQGQIYTSKNPLFVITNAERDFTYAVSTLIIKEGKEYEGKFLKNLPKSGKALRKVLYGNAKELQEKDPQLYKMYQEYVMNGGKTGYFRLFDLKKSQEAYEKSVAKGDKKSVAKITFDAIGAANEFAETINRFSVYMTSREMGKSIVQSVDDAKNVTLNFDMKGTGDGAWKYFKAIYAFQQVAVNALANITNLGIKNPKGLASLVATYTTLGVLEGLMSALLGGDDGDDKYASLSPMDRRNNMQIYTPYGFIKWFLPQELRIAKGLGSDMYLWSRGKLNGEDLTWSLISNIADLLPVNVAEVGEGGYEHGIKGAVAKLAPTALAPEVQLALNLNFKNDAIVNGYVADKKIPGFRKARVNKKGKPYAPAIVYDLSKWLNYSTGGDDVVPGKVSFNPDIVHHLLSGHFGGLYKLAVDAASSASNTAQNKETTIRDTPLGKFFTSFDDLRERNVGLNNSYYDIRNDIKQRFEYRNKYFKELGFEASKPKIEDLGITEQDKEAFGYIKMIERGESRLDDVSAEEQDLIIKTNNELKKLVIKIKAPKE